MLICRWCGKYEKKRRSTQKREEGQCSQSPAPPPTFAGLPVGDGLAHVAVVSLLAVVAVAASSVVAAVEADAPTLAPRQLVQLHVEAAAPGMQVAVAGCGGGRERYQGRGTRGGPKRPCPPTPSFYSTAGQRGSLFSGSFLVPQFAFISTINHLVVPEPWLRLLLPPRWRLFISLSAWSTYTPPSWEAEVASSLCSYPACYGLTRISPPAFIC